MADRTQEYVALCTSLRLSHRFRPGDRFARQEPQGAVSASSVTVFTSHQDQRMPSATGSLAVWLPSLSDWAELMAEEARREGDRSAAWLIRWRVLSDLAWACAKWPSCSAPEAAARLFAARKGVGGTRSPE